VVTGDSQEEVMIFRYRQTDRQTLHHNIYITTTIIIKVIVPNSTAGMIIGKGGSYIKHLKETSGSFIQLSQKAKDNTLPERVVTIIGENCKKKQDQANPIF